MTFYFAWVDEGTAFNAVTHAVNDLRSYEIEIDQSEGDFAGLRLEIKNPKVGILAPGRKQWAWLSWNNSGTVVPLFYGRVIGAPEQIQNEVIRLEFVARPVDMEEQKVALAATLRVRPFWDPAWVDEDKRLDADTVLEARTQQWHFDRITHDVTVSDILVGEDGTLSFSASQHYKDDFDVSYGQAPVRRVRVEATAVWSQFGAGIVNLNAPLKQAFFNAGATHYGLAASFSGDGLQGDWPKAAASFGGGWSVHTSTLTRVDGIRFETRYQSHNFAVYEKNAAGIITKVTPSVAWYPLWEFDFFLDVQYSATRQYIELVTFDLEADVQSIIAEPGDEEVITLKPKSADLSLPIGGTLYPAPFEPGFVAPVGGVWYGSGYAVGSDIPIGDIGRRAYFPTDRGYESLDYLVMLARAHLLMRARAVEVSFRINWLRGLDITLRKSVTIFDPRLPGGQASGKVIAYSMFVNGDSGDLHCDVTLGCSIGRGELVEARAGDPVYAAAGYMAPGYQQYDDRDNDPLDGEVVYALPNVPPNDDGLDFTHAGSGDLILNVAVTGGPSAQRVAIQALPSPDPENLYQKVLSITYTHCIVQMRPVEGGPFNTPYDMYVSQLTAPKTIDLEAAAI